jgi:hypothetical protein
MYSTLNMYFSLNPILLAGVAVSALGQSGHRSYNRLKINCNDTL